MHVIILKIKHMQGIPQGRLILKLGMANLYKDYDWFFKEDPYVVLNCGGKKYTTKVAYHGGKHPVFNEVRLILVNEFRNSFLK